MQEKYKIGHPNHSAQSPILRPSSEHWMAANKQSLRKTTLRTDAIKTFQIQTYLSKLRNPSNGKTLPRRRFSELMAFELALDDSEAAGSLEKNNFESKWKISKLKVKIIPVKQDIQKLLRRAAQKNLKKLEECSFYHIWGVYIMFESSTKLRRHMAPARKLVQNSSLCVSSYLMQLWSKDWFRGQKNTNSAFWDFWLTPEQQSTIIV